MSLLAGHGYFKVTPREHGSPCCVVCHSMDTLARRFSSTTPPQGPVKDASICLRIFVTSLVGFKGNLSLLESMLSFCPVD